MRRSVQDVKALHEQLRAQEKTIRILAERLEQQVADDVSGFTLFEQNISLENVVARRTRELEEHRKDLEKALDELKATQAELLQAQKQQAIGQLAAGIAHEINTPSQYVGNNLSFLQESIADLLRSLLLCRKVLQADGEGGGLSPADCRQLLEQILERADLDFLEQEVPRALDECDQGIRRIAAIVGAMKDFAQPSGGRMQPVNLARLIRSTIVISRTEWQPVAELEFDCEPSLPSLPGLSDELGQVLLNLIINAAQAIGESAGTEARKGSIRIAARRADDWIEILVQDNGCGIPQELQQKIFDPFFTTREVGRGAGQGLAIAYNVVTSRHHGELLVNSAPGQGTTFTIRLPFGEGHA